MRRVWLFLHGRPAIIKRAPTVVLGCVKVAGSVEGGSLLGRRILRFPTNRIHSVGTRVLVWLNRCFFPPSLANWMPPLPLCEASYELPRPASDLGLRGCESDALSTMPRRLVVLCEQSVGRDVCATTFELL